MDNEHNKIHQTMNTEAFQDSRSEGWLGLRGQCNDAQETRRSSPFYFQSEKSNLIHINKAMKVVDQDLRYQSRSNLITILPFAIESHPGSHEVVYVAFSRFQMNQFLFPIRFWSREHHTNHQSKNQFQHNSHFGYQR